MLWRIDSRCFYSRFVVGVHTSMTSRESRENFGASFRISWEPGQSSTPSFIYGTAIVSTSVCGQQWLFQNRSAPSTYPSASVAQRRVIKSVVKKSRKIFFSVSDTFVRDTLALLMMQPDLVAANQDILYVRVNSERDGNLNLHSLQLLFLPHQSKTRTFPALLLILYLLLLTD